MSDDLKVGATGNTGQGVGQVDGAANEQKRTELEQKQLTEGLAGKKEKTTGEEDTVTVTVENGESIAKIAKKYGVSVKEIMDLNEKQIKYFKNAKDCDDKEKHAGFLVGAKIKLPANANMKAVEENLKTTVEAERKKYEESMKKLDKELCDDRTKSYRVMDEDFRKEHNIRTKGEYAAEQGAPSAPETPETPEDPKGNDDGVQIPFRPPEDKGTEEPPKFEIPKFPGAELPKEDPIQVPLRPKDEAPEAPKAPEDPKGNDDGVQIPLRPPEDKGVEEPPKWDVPKFPGAELPKEDEVQVPLRPKDEAPEAPKAPETPKTPPENKKPEAPKGNDNDVQIPLRPPEDKGTEEPPKFDVPKFPGAELPKEDEVQVPLRPKDETPEAPNTPKAPETQKAPKDNDEGTQIPLRPSEDDPGYEPPAWGVPQFPGGQTPQKADSTEVKTEERMPSIEEMSEQAKKNREANKPWWKFW